MMRKVSPTYFMLHFMVRQFKIYLTNDVNILETKCTERRRMRDASPTHFMLHFMVPQYKFDSFVHKNLKDV